MVDEVSDVFLDLIPSGWLGNRTPDAPADRLCLKHLETLLGRYLPT
jgi:hypothetical protein